MSDRFPEIKPVLALESFKRKTDKVYPSLECLSIPFDPIPMAGLKGATTLQCDAQSRAMP